jgi:flagellar biosynthesis chaperone FliJ
MTQKKNHEKLTDALVEQTIKDVEGAIEAVSNIRKEVKKAADELEKIIEETKKDD